jgi:hypothetical protein
VNEEQVFVYLKQQKKGVLLDYLHAAFDIMDAKQRRAVFADVGRSLATSARDGRELQEEIEEFHRDSLAGEYYAPFNVNSKNYRNVPKKTQEWCDRFASFVAQACKLAGSEEHSQAVCCFALLYELLEAVDSGEVIIFAEEAGSWMISTDEKAWLKTYLTSLAASATPAQFTAATIPMMERDSGHSFAAQVHASALKVANPQQKAHLQAEVPRRNIRTP